MCHSSSSLLLFSGPGDEPTREKLVKLKAGVHEPREEPPKEPDVDEREPENCETD